MKRTLIDQAPFEFSARVTLQLGRESISSSTVAISELIKNSYDADSASVDIDFYIKKYATSSLVIKDDGEGMTKEDLVSKWLTVGTNNKVSTEKTKNKKRVLTGAKGLGRLGIDRLCKKLVLYTKTADMDNAVQLDLDWHKYEDTDKRLSEIKHNIYEVELPIRDKYGNVFMNKEDCGTRMVLIGLKDEWNEDFLSALENELRLLVSPFQSQNEFSINLSRTEDDLRLTKKLSSEDILSLAIWKVVAEVDELGNVRTEYTNQEKNLTIQEEPTPWEEWIKHAGIRPQFGPVTLEFYYIPEKPTSLKRVNLGRRDFQNFMKLNRGVRIYRDHFRVRPYGEPSGKGDWLDIGYRKASSPAGIAQSGGGWRVGPNQILGSVLISRTTNSVLNDQANREGIVENDAFFQLRTFVLKVIDTFETHAHKDAASDKEVSEADRISAELEAAQKEAKRAAKQLTDTVKIPRKKKNKKSPTVSQIVSRKIAAFEEAQAHQKKKEEELLEALEAEKKELQEQKDTLTNLASLGILTVCFGHEIRQHTAQASGDTTLIEYLIEDSINEDTSINVNDLHEHTGSIRKSISYIENYSKLTLSNIKPDKRTRKKVNIPSVFRYVFDLLAESFKEMGIEHVMTFNGIDESDANVRSFEIDWESIAINLITNSMWAMDSIQDKRKIEIEFNRIDEARFEICFRDSGVGLEEGSEEHIFMPMNSGKRDRTGNIIGTGMGLSIVKTHVEDHTGGIISANKNSSLGGAEFVFTLPISK